MKNFRNKKIRVFYTKKQVCFDNIKEKSFSQSPLKPYLLMKRIKKSEYNEMFEVETNFKPYIKEDFYIAHTKKYVKNMFKGKGNCTSNGLPWSKNLIESLTYTNASLYEAIKYAYLNPNTVTFSPVSGMHHAHPNSGSGFCSFAGQVISAIKMYNEFKAVGVYFDLDGHYGNSIECARKFNKIIDFAIPKGYNVNVLGNNEEYVKNFDDKLTEIGYDMLHGKKIDYVVFAHGADSHEDDDLHGSMNTKNWLKCATIFANWVNELSMFLGRPIPVILALFGGYRSDDYNAVLDLHIKSLIQISNIVCGNNFIDRLKIPKKQKFKYNFDYAVSNEFETNIVNNNERKNYIDWFRERNNKKRLALFGTIK